MNKQMEDLALCSLTQQQGTGLGVAETYPVLPNKGSAPPLKTEKIGYKESGSFV